MSNDPGGDPPTPSGDEDGSSRPADDADAPATPPDVGDGPTTPPDAGDGSDDQQGRFPWRAGATRGVAAFVVGLLAVAALVLLEQALSGDLAGLADATDGLAGNPLYAAGWLFYNAHFVGVVVGGEAVNLVDALRGSGTVPASLFYAIQPAVLYLAGNSVAVTCATPDDSRPRRGAMGAATAAGYLPLSVLGAVAFTAEGAGPNLVGAALIAGLAYPVVLGGLGGYSATVDGDD
jgi:hypothetical protein